MLRKKKKFAIARAVFLPSVFFAQLFVKLSNCSYVENFFCTDEAINLRLDTAHALLSRKTKGRTDDKCHPERKYRQIQIYFRKH
jgi:hypothetical protein